MEYKDYYTTLGVDRKATQDEIKHAYRRLARKYHPDVSKEKDAEEKFKNVQEAYEVLKDSEKRAAYDQLGSNWKAGQEFRPPPGWDSSTRFYTSQDFGDFSEADLGGFSDFFNILFGRATRSRAGSGFERHFEGFKQRGQDQQAKVNISLEEAFRGTTKTLQLQVPEIDPSGAVHYKMRILKVNIPSGAMPGQQLRLTGQGAPGVGGGPAGDIYLEIDIEPHHLFSLQGRDIYLMLPVTPWEAALGTSIKIPTLAGRVELKLIPNSQAGQKLRLKGKGMPGKPEPGNMYVVLQILIPPAHDDEQRKIYEKMAQVMPFNPRKDWSV
jgi:curved DNA-binding protein